MNFFTEILYDFVDLESCIMSYDWEKLHHFATIGQEELNKLIIAFKPTTYLIDPIPTKL